MSTTSTLERPTAVAEASGPAAVEITYFTDPLCCWSWAMEPQWRLLRYAFTGRLSWRMRMGGMIAGWGSYDDPLNSVHRPGQMGPLWMAAEQESGMPMDTGLWVEDPPDSSWPACEAFKAAETQSPHLGSRYLRRLWEAAMTGRQNIARRSVLLDIASGEAAGGLDVARFEADLDGGAARKAFHEDLKEARYLEIGRFPTLILRGPGGGRRVLTGWRPYDALEAAILALAPELGPGNHPADPERYAACWPSITRREMKEAFPKETAPAG
ncbi:DsbA family protein [Inquilinus sp. CAU 1745]|uniref:DsbA family protein n=1 Tax=Inquilinus sp. CAU 1745 TaxID=3140369 RepID=UPI00325A73AB